MTRFWRAGLILLAGLALGVTITALAPRVVGPYLAEVLRGKMEIVEGAVTQKQRQQNRLLLTVVTPQGAVLATFKHKVVEVDQLVEQRDVLTLAVRRFEPFIDDPAIQRVQKQVQADGPPGSETPPPGGARPKPKGSP
jgi:hypothetical protein